jgi:DNA-binding MarR family transcriptional regulator
LVDVPNSAPASTARRGVSPPSPSRAPAPEATELFIALGAVVKRLRKHPLPSEASTFVGTTPAPRHIHALLHIAADGPIGMTELAERLHVSLATMSQVVTELGDWGLIERSSDEADRRRTLVSVAAEHRPMIEAILDSRMQPLQSTLRRLSAAEAAALVKGLLVLSEELDLAHAEKEPTR